jgi:hypothetical protein
MPQMLPPELMKKAVAPPLLNNNNMLHKMTSQPQPQTPAYGIDPSKMQLPCANCKAILNVPHGLARFQCPQCFVDLAVDLSKIKQLFPPHATPPLPLPPPSRTVLPLPPLPRLVLPPPPLEEVNEVLHQMFSVIFFVSSICIDGVKSCLNFLKLGFSAECYV